MIEVTHDATVRRKPQNWYGRLFDILRVASTVPDSGISNDWSASVYLPQNLFPQPTYLPKPNRTYNGLSVPLSRAHCRYSQASRLEAAGHDERFKNQGKEDPSTENEARAA